MDDCYEEIIAGHRVEFTPASGDWVDFQIFDPFGLPIGLGTTGATVCQDALASARTKARRFIKKYGAATLPPGVRVAVTVSDFVVA